MTGGSTPSTTYAWERKFDATPDPLALTDPKHPLYGFVAKPWGEGEGKRAAIRPEDKDAFKKAYEANPEAYKDYKDVYYNMTGSVAPKTNDYSTIMDNIFGAGNWQQFMNTGDRSGQLTGGRGTISPESIYASSAANLMNAKAYAIGQAYNQWNQKKLNYSMDQLTGSGLGIGMTSGDTSRYNSLRNQMLDQQNQQALWNRTAMAIGGAPVIPMQPRPQTTSSTGWMSPGGGFGGFGFGG